MLAPKTAGSRAKARESRRRRRRLFPANEPGWVLVVPLRASDLFLFPVSSAMENASARERFRASGASGLRTWARRLCSPRRSAPASTLMGRAPDSSEAGGTTEVDDVASVGLGHVERLLAADDPAECDDRSR